MGYTIPAKMQGRFRAYSYLDPRSGEPLVQIEKDGWVEEAEEAEYPTDLKALISMSPREDGSILPA